MKQKLVLLSVLFVLLPVLSLSAADMAPRDFSPAQKGFVKTGKSVLPYAPDRIMVKFTETSYKNSNLRINLQRGTEVSGAKTGIASVDALGNNVGALSISRPYYKPANSIAASRLGVDRWFKVKLPTGSDIPAIAAKYESDPNIEYARPDYRAFPAVVPGDPLYPDHWGHNNTAQLPSYDWNTYSHTGPEVGTVGFDANAEAAWSAGQGYGSSSVIIAILDSGVDTSHPDLNLISGYDFGDGDTNPDDDSSSPGHGTCCAGVAASIADNGIGAAGAAPGCSIMPCKIADSGGSMYFSYIENALYWAADNGADVISMSLGAAITSDPATDAALEYAYNAGVVIFAATGNENMSTISYPAINPYVIGVGAASPCGDRKRSSSSSAELNPGVEPDPNGYTCDGERWWGSNYGTTTPDDAGAVDIIAPTILPTTDISGNGGYQSGDYEPFFNGTSCATPYAAGVAGLVKSANPTWTPSQIRDQLTGTAIDIVNVESGTGWDRYSGYGMVDAEAAVGGGTGTAPVAAFSGNPTSGDAPLTVSFTDESTGSPTSWSWDFGDGGTSTAQNPSYEYAASGTYTVTLTVSNSYGSDIETKTDYITVTEPTNPPVAAFSGSPTSGEVPLTVAFTDESTNNPTSWSWDFGDGATSTAQNPSHEYTAVGTYTVSLTATNTYGSDSETKTDYITVTEEAVSEKAYALSDIAVTGSVSGDYTNTFSSDNSYETITEVAYTGHPRKTYSYLEHKWDFNVASGTNPTFYLEAYRPSSSDGDDFSFEYTTNGTDYYSLVTVASSTEQVYSATLPDGTSGSLTVRVTDTQRNWGGTSNDDIVIDEMYIEVASSGPTAPTAAFSGSPTTGAAPLTVNFTDQSSGSPTSWSWDFGDGATSTAQNPSHEYTAVGTYTVSLTATNAYGSDTEAKTDYIDVTDGTTSAIHVSSITVGRNSRGVNLNGTAAVTVVDQNGSPVANATVYGFFNVPSTSTKSAVTGSDGVANLTGDRTKDSVSDFCFEVTDVTLSGYTYDSAANTVTKSCESGDVFNSESRVLSGRETTPDSYKLAQNHPNPFNPVTTINFNLPERARVRLEIFDVQGKLVETLVNKSLDAGIHSKEWTAKNVSSGVYFYRLSTPSFTEIKKMVLLR
ncbi:MAG TPA: PKD domain-containing protein [Candidatus Krumholzibacteriaceae bacterium]|nr:PKD domain-containing protein [Candidatus Krumholzibacteriaceae bacterium]